MQFGWFWFCLGHGLGLSVVGGSNLTNRGERSIRESVGADRCEKTPVCGSVGFLRVRERLNWVVFAWWHGLQRGCVLSTVFVPPAASSMMWSTSVALSPQIMQVLPHIRKQALRNASRWVVVPLSDLDMGFHDVVGIYQSTFVTCVCLV